MIFVTAQCECGTIKEYKYQLLKNGHTKSCGCISRIANGNSSKRLYQIWRHMQDRCYNEKNVRYENYAGRGIIVCDEWRNSFETFERWALANGYQENLTIDRIDNNSNYEPSNCRWITVKEQNNNRNNSIIITKDNETKTLAQWCEDLNLPYSVIYARITTLKWDPVKALTTNVDKYKE